MEQLGSEGKAAFVLSTCNRSELYVDSHDLEAMAVSFCTAAGLELNEFRDKMYFLNGPSAINHLFRVSAGLDSQILGDFEIVGQIKRDYQLAKNVGSTNAKLERWVNTALQISKRVKNETSISSGASSVAFASIEYLKKKGHSLKDKNVLVVGAGKIGINTCKNIIKHGSRDRITIANRTNAKAKG